MSARFIVIDGLDECQDPDVQCDLLKIIASAVPRLPPHTKILLASRPETYLRRSFDYDTCLQSIRVRRIDLDLDQDARHDIQKFLQKGFQEIHRTHPLRAYLASSWPSKDVITTLVGKSYPQFIYASTVIKYIRSPRHRPDKRLEIILGISVTLATDLPFAELDALYTLIFSAVDEEHRDLVWRIFGILHAARLADFKDKDMAVTPEKLEEMLELEAGYIQILLEPLVSLIHLPISPTGPVYFLHASIFDYLLDPSRSGDFRLDLSFAHETLASHQYRFLTGPRGKEYMFNNVLKAHVEFNRTSRE